MVKMLLGVVLQKPIRVSWLAALFKGLRSVHDQFITYTDLKVYEIKFNGQTIKLEKLLQNKFGPGIYIVNNGASLDSFLIGDGVDTGSYIGDGPDVDAWIGEDYNPALTNFTVNVPVAIVFVQDEMKAWINKYKLLGTTYNILIV